MPKRNILILGGARSGKSRHAQELACSISENTLFVATAEALDAEMTARISKHREERPASWRTLEVSTGVVAGLQRHLNGIEVVLLDCVTLLVSNVLLGQGRGLSESLDVYTPDAGDPVRQEIESLIGVMRVSKASFIVVSNELGLGLVPENQLARIYRDLLGQANQMLAEAADEVYLMVAGIPLRIKG